jgi:CRISPR-associated endoribonuclease Cas6
MIKLRCTEDSHYEMQYHYHLQGFIYSLLKDSKYNYLHDKEGYKFFCFSNIFPAYDLRRGDLRTLIVSSPDEGFVKYLSAKAQNLHKTRTVINLGSMEFKLEDINELHVQIPRSSFTLITGTPIIIRIHKEKYKVVGLRSDIQFDEVYWRKDHPIVLFIEQIESNLSKKYYEYAHLKGYDTKDGVNNQSNSKMPFIQSFRFKKQISTRVYMKGNYHVVIGTLWEFGFNQDIIDRRLIQFA